MAIGGVSGGSGFLQVNNMVSRIGEEKAAMYMQRSKSHYQVSNFGNETKLGTSSFQRENEKVLNTGEKKTSMLVDRIQAVTDVSNFGNEVKSGKGKFNSLQNSVAKSGDSIVAAAMKSAKQAYSKARAAHKSGIDMNAG